MYTAFEREFFCSDLAGKTIATCCRVVMGLLITQIPHKTSTHFAPEVTFMHVLLGDFKRIIVVVMLLLSIIY